MEYTDNNFFQYKYLYHFIQYLPTTLDWQCPPTHSATHTTDRAHPPTMTCNVDVYMLYILNTTILVYWHLLSLYYDCAKASQKPDCIVPFWSSTMQYSLLMSRLSRVDRFMSADREMEHITPWEWWHLIFFP